LASPIKIPSEIPNENGGRDRKSGKSLFSWFGKKPVDKSALQEENSLFSAKKQNLLNTLFLFAIRVVAIVLMVMFLVRIWHIIAPWQSHWLMGSDLEELDRFLFSGALGTLLGKYADKAFVSDS
jgi:hypothetical protein